MLKMTVQHSIVVLARFSFPFLKRTQQTDLQEPLAIHEQASFSWLMEEMVYFVEQGSLVSIKIQTWAE